MTRVIVTSKRHRHAARQAYDDFKDFLPTHRRVKSSGFRRAVNAANKAIEMLIKGTSAQQKMRREIERVREQARRKLEPYIRLLLRGPGR